ncbi:MAG: hypothetical protein ACYC1C_16240 [Chloroflexota bacterium]
MYDRLPEEQDKIRQELLQHYIASQAGADGYLDGLATIMAAFQVVLVDIVGQTGTRAIFARVAYLARQKDPRYEALAPSESGLDLGRLKVLLQKEKPATARASANELLEMLFVVLHSLFGYALTPFLQEVVTALPPQNEPVPKDVE